MILKWTRPEQTVGRGDSQAVPRDLLHEANAEQDLDEQKHLHVYGRARALAEEKRVYVWLPQQEHGQAER